MNTFLDESIRRQVRELFREMDKPVTIRFFRSSRQNCAYCHDTNQLLREIEELSDKVEVQAFDLDEKPELEKPYHVEMTPCIILGTMHGDQFQDARIRYYGIPAGHEFNSLVRSILLVSTGKTDLKEETKKFIATNRTPISLRVFVTPYCPHCPKAVSLTHQLVLENPLVSAEVVESREFEDLAAKWNISGVPNTIVNNGAGYFTGALSENQFIEKLRQIVETNQVEA